MSRPEGPYEIETPLLDGKPDWAKSNVVRLPRPEDGPDAHDGLITVFSGTFAECDAWIEAHPA